MALTQRSRSRRRWTSTWPGGGFTSLEEEGLDITETNPNSPGVTGQIHVQILGNKISDDEWSLINLAVSDLSRL